MKTIIGILGIIASIVLGVYVGGWLMLAGGVIGLVKAMLALLGGKVLTGLISWSIIKILFSGLAGYLSFALLFLPSWALTFSGKFGK
jgi:hypothetical protein